MSRRILMNVADGDECRIAVIEDGRLYEYFVDRPSQLKHVGNIYKGMIQNVEPGIQAAFVDIGLERNGFLHVSDVLYAYENNPKLTDLFPRTLRIREQLPEESMLSNSSEQEVEEVSDFVGDGHTAHHGQAAPENGNGHEGTPENVAPREAAFLDKLDETQPGHRISDSPLEVAPPQPEPMPELSAHHAEREASPSPAVETRQSVVSSRQSEEAANAHKQEPQAPARGAGTEPQDTDTDADDDEDGDETDLGGGQPQAGPVQLGPDGLPLRKRRRRGRRGGRRRREAREAAARRAAQDGSAPAAAGEQQAMGKVAGQEQRGAAGAPASTGSGQASAGADEEGQSAAATTGHKQEPQAPARGAVDTWQAHEQEPPAGQAQDPQAQDRGTDDATAGTPATGDNSGGQSNPRPKKRRMPKKRGGHLPKRLFESDGAPPPAPGTPSGGDGSAPPGGPALRFHRGPLPKIQNLLKRDQEVVVQVAKASQGGKGPGLTSMVSLPGRYMVLTPNSQRGGVSRKIEDGGARNELRKILDRLPVPEGMGVIIRTAAINRSFDDLNRDLNYLLRLWNVITTRIAEAPAPALLYSDSDPAIRTVRDYFTAETEEIVIDDRAVYERVLGFFDQLMPSFKDRVKLYEGEVPLFFAEGMEGQIERIFDKKVNLKSGGYLYVEQTEALVSIDVNSGKFTSAGDAERTAYLTNLEAIPEICRQLRLRDLAGIVCCDLIDMMSAKHRSDIENALRRELRRDRARTKVARMSPFGVIEMTRQRVRPSIKAYTYVGCPTCNGFGMVHSAETMCLSLIRRMKLALCEQRVFELVVQVHPHVLSHLHSEFREDIDLVEEEFDKRVIFEYARDLTLGQSRFYYVNDRQARVVYDMDQRINSFVRNEAHKVRSNVAPPPSAVGAPGTVFATGERRDSKRRRRGGRRQREREQERISRSQRIDSESQKAVSFGADLPELPPMEVIREPQPAQQGQQGQRGDSGRDRGRDGGRDGGRRGRRGRGRGRDRHQRQGQGSGTGAGQGQGQGQGPDRPAREPEPPVRQAQGEQSPPREVIHEAPVRQAQDSAARGAVEVTQAAVASAQAPATGGDKKTSRRRKPAGGEAKPKSTGRRKPAPAEKKPARKPAARKPAAKRPPKKKAE